VAQRDALSSLLQPQVLHDDDDKPIPTSIVNIVDNTVLYFIRSSYGTGIIILQVAGAQSHFGALNVKFFNSRRFILTVESS